jgi:hypothetical protein
MPLAGTRGPQTTTTPTPSPPPFPPGRTRHQRRRERKLPLPRCARRDRVRAPHANEQHERDGKHDGHRPAAEGVVLLADAHRLVLPQTHHRHLGAQQRAQQPGVHRVGQAPPAREGARRGGGGGGGGGRGGGGTSECAGRAAAARAGRAATAHGQACVRVGGPRPADSCDVGRAPPSSSPSQQQPLPAAAARLLCLPPPPSPLLPPRPLPLTGRRPAPCR